MTLLELDFCGRHKKADCLDSNRSAQLALFPSRSPRPPGALSICTPLGFLGPLWKAETGLSREVSREKRSSIALGPAVSSTYRCERREREHEWKA